MQGTANFHDHVAYPRFPPSDGLLKHAAAFDAAVDMFDAHAPPSELAIPRFLGPRQGAPAGFLRGVEDVHAGQRERLTAQIWPPLTAGRSGGGRGISDALVLDTARRRLTEAQKAPGPIAQQAVGEHVPLVLAALTPVLFSRVLGAWDGSLGAIVTKKGPVVDGATRPSSAAAGSTRTGGAAPPSRPRKASTRRQGASPKVRRA